jgi:dienelactone hydrolase
LYADVSPPARPVNHVDATARGRPSASPSRKSQQPALAPLPVGQLSTYHFAKENFVFTEPAHGSAGPRVLRVTVRFPFGKDLAAYRPRARGLFPLVVFAPGFRQCARSYSDLLGQWTTAGYVVAAVDFPLTSCTTPSPDEADLANQPADVAYIIRRLLELSSSRGSRLAGLISPGEIAVSGHSDGGDTVAAMAAATCCRDRQVRAAVILAGAEWPPLPGRWFAGPVPPILLVQGTADTWNFPEASRQLYLADTAGARYYLNLPGSDHFAPYQGDGTPEPVVARVSIDFLDYYLLGERDRLGAMWRASRDPGVAKMISAGQPPP